MVEVLVRVLSIDVSIPVEGRSVVVNVCMGGSGAIDVRVNVSSCGLVSVLINVWRSEAIGVRVGVSLSRLVGVDADGVRNGTQLNVETRGTNLSDIGVGSRPGAVGVCVSVRNIDVGCIVVKCRWRIVM